MPAPTPSAGPWSALSTPGPAILDDLSSLCPDGRGNPGTGQWAVAGQDWDAVAVPLETGLAALDRLHVKRSAGYPVLVDYLLRRLYIWVRAGEAWLCSAVPGARVLSAGAEVLVPGPGQAGTIRASWLSPPRRHPRRRLVDASDLAIALHLASIGLAQARRQPPVGVKTRAARISAGPGASWPRMGRGVSPPCGVPLAFVPRPRGEFPAGRSRGG